MYLYILAYLGGLLTILSPCILPVLPFVFSRAENSFRKSGLPLLLGMGATFVLISTLAVVGGDWVIHANQLGRSASLVLLMLFAFTLIFPEFADKLLHPITQFGTRLSQNKQGAGFVGSFVLGIATGLLWAPCAGPILGLILTGAAIQGANLKSSTLLFAYALGAMTSLAIAIFAGNRALKVMRRYLGADRYVRRTLGCLVLLGVVAIGFGWDQGILTRLSRFHTESFEQKLIGLFHPNAGGSTASTGNDDLNHNEGPMPELTGANEWINSAPLSPKDLAGKVVLVDFWTYSCINCLRSLPYMRNWAEKYAQYGLVVIGVHTPEFAFEKDSEHVKKAVKELGITYPVAIDSDFAIWTRFNTQYWPSHYFIDAQGMMRHHHFGEGDYEKSEMVLQQLLRENHQNIAEAIDRAGPQTPGSHAGSLSLGTAAGNGSVGGPSNGVELEGSDQVLSGETYIGYERAQGFVINPAPKQDETISYILAPSLELNQWSLGGQWEIQSELAQLTQSPGKIVFHFHARDLHLVLGIKEDEIKGAPADGQEPKKKSIRFVVKLDGVAPYVDHGTDIDEAGNGQVQEHRLYQLIRQSGQTTIQDRTFEIEFLDPGVQAFAFTFG